VPQLWGFRRGVPWRNGAMSRPELEVADCLPRLWAAMAALRPEGWACWPKKCEPAGLVGGEELGKHQPLEQFGEHGHGQQEAGLTRQPMLPIQDDAAARHDHMDMRVMGHGRGFDKLSPRCGARR
jgi:hypothetical protein